MTLYDVLEVATGTIVINTKQTNVLTWHGGEYECDECFNSEFLNKKVKNIYASDNYGLVVYIEGFN